MLKEITQQKNMNDRNKILFGFWSPFLRVVVVHQC